MKETLKFNLPDDYSDYIDAIHGSDYRRALDEILQMLRSRVKHGHNYENTEQALQEVYEFVCSSIAECYGFPE